MIAELSECKRFRYLLSEKISDYPEKHLIGGLCNPSDAGSLDENGEMMTDNTFEKFKAIGLNNQCSHVHIVNVIPYITPDVKEAEAFLDTITEDLRLEMLKINSCTINRIKSLPGEMILLEVVWAFLS